MDDYLTMTTRHQIHKYCTFAKCQPDDFYEQEYVICASTSGDYETTLQYSTTVERAPECGGHHRNDLESQSSLLYILATRLHQSQNVSRETKYIECMWAVWERRCRIFFFTSNLIAAAVRYGSYREGGKK